MSAVLKSERNYNNGLGLPLSVLRMVSEGQSPSQLMWQCLRWECRHPRTRFSALQNNAADIGVELMIAPVHLEYLGSIENIAAAKAELIEGLKPDGIAILNADDEWVIKMRDKHKGARLLLGSTEPMAQRMSLRGRLIPANSV